MALAIVLIVLAVNIYFSGHLASINLEYSHKRQSFWTRNKDQIIIAIVGAVIGGVVVLGLSWFIK